MGFYEYLLLSTDQQWNELWNNGKHITNYKSIDCSFSLYALHKFYVEIELCVSTNKIIAKSEFVCGHALDKYAGNINIKEV